MDYDALGYVIIWSVCAIVIVRFWKSWYALYLETRRDGASTPIIFSLMKQYREFKKAHIADRKEWADRVIEQENNRQGTQ